MTFPPFTTNRLLDSLSPASRDRILRASRPIKLPPRTELMEPGEPLRYGYFMTSGIASVVVELEEGSVAEVALIGREDVVGGMQLLGPALSPTRCFVQMEGTALRIPFATLKQIFLESEEVRSRVLEMVQQQSLTISQLAACNRLHEAKPRLARWLLMVRDRVQQNTLHLTQEFLAQMLGTQRTTVVMAAGAFQRSGFIAYSRGKVTILAPEQMEDASCDCYGVVRKLYYGPLREVVAMSAIVQNGRESGRYTRQHGKDDRWSAFASHHIRVPGRVCMSHASRYCSVV